MSVSKALLVGAVCVVEITLAMAGAAGGEGHYADALLPAVAGHVTRQLVAQQKRMINSSVGPVLPGVWSSHVTQYTGIGDGSPIVATGVQSSDNRTPGARSYSRSDKKVTFVPLAYVDTPLEWMNNTRYSVGTFTGILSNEVALYAGDGLGGFQDVFAWTRYATRVNANDDGIETWALRASGAYLEVDVVATLNIPVRFTSVLTGKHPGIPDGFNTTVLYDGFMKGGDLPGVWDDFDENAFTHPPVCQLPSDNEQGRTTTGTIEPVKTTTMYIFHPAHNYNISSQDAADVVGDTAFTCAALIAQGQSSWSMDYQWITEWAIEHDTRVGEYQICNGYDPASCFGANTRYVGHMAAYYIGHPLGGQCQMNPLVGEWYSLPERGRCSDHTVPSGAPDGDGCTWRATRVKTIDSQCLLRHNFVDKCIDGGGRLPFPSATAAFRRAFESDTVADGGCPPIA